MGHEGFARESQLRIHEAFGLVFVFTLVLTFPFTLILALRYEPAERAGSNTADRSHST